MNWTNLESEELRGERSISSSLPKASTMFRGQWFLELTRPAKHYWGERQTKSQKKCPFSHPPWPKWIISVISPNEIVMSGHLTYFCCCRFFQKLFNHCRPPTTPYYCTGFPFRLLKWFPRCLGDVLMLWSWKNEASCSSAAEIKLMLPFYVGFYLKKKRKIGRFNNTAVRLLI